MRRWVLAGVALDAATLFGLYSLLLSRWPPRSAFLKGYLVVEVLVAVPWVVHVAVLPLAFRLTPTSWANMAKFLGQGAVFIASTAVVVPVFGIPAFLLVGGVFVLLTPSNFRMNWGPPSALGKVVDDAIWLLTALPVGTAIGGLLHASRIPLDHLKSPRLRSDVVGALFAVLLAGVGMFATIPLGLFFRATANPNSLDWMHPLLYVPQLTSLVVIGTFALIPHLIMTGRDLQRRSPVLPLPVTAAEI